MSITKIDGERQIKNETIVDANISVSAGISMGKIASGYKILLNDSAQLTANMDANSNRIINLGNPQSDTDAVNLAYVQQVVTQGKTWKEVLLHENQLSTSGIGNAQILSFSDSGSTTVTTGDSVTVDGWEFVVDTDVSKGATIEDFITNLTNAINSNGSNGLEAYEATIESLNSYRNIIVIIKSEPTESMPASIYGTFSVSCRILPTADYGQGSGSAATIGYTNVYSSSIDDLISIPSYAASNFGWGRVAESITPNATHMVRHNDSSYTWDNDGLVWQQTGSASIPYASIDTYGKVKIGNGLNVSSGLVSVDTAADGGLTVDSSGVSVDHDADTLNIVNGKLAVSSDGIHSTQIDWGTGTDQVSHDDVPDGATYKRYNPASVNITGGNIANTTLADTNTIKLASTFMFLGGSGGDASRVRLVKGETPNESPDGIIMAFTLDYTPVSNTEDVYLNGVRQRNGASADYTLSGNTITFNFAPENTDDIVVSYLATS